MGKIIISNNPIYDFKLRALFSSEVNALFSSKECKVTSYSIGKVDKSDYALHKLKESHSGFGETFLESSYIFSSERESYIDNVNVNRKITFEGRTDCYEDTWFDFLIFRTDDHKIITKGSVKQESGRFKSFEDTSIANVGDANINCDFEKSYTDCAYEEYQVLFKLKT